MKLLRRKIRHIVKREVLSMSKKLTLTMTLALSAMLIAACGQGDDKQAKEQEQEPIEVVADEKEAADTQEEAEQEQVKEQQAADTQEEEKAETETATSTEKEKETTTAPVEAAGTASTQMPYTVALNQGFTLNAEEPGRDQIISSANNSLSMRIQVATTEEDTFASVKDNALMYMQAVGEPTEMTAAELAPLGNATGWKTAFDDDLVYVIAFEQNGLVGQLTIYDKTDAQALASFLQMASTITKK